MEAAGDFGGLGKKKGKKQAKHDAEVRRELERIREDNLAFPAPAYLLPPERYADGSVIVRHLLRENPDLLRGIVYQTREILLFSLNKGRPFNQHSKLDTEKFIRDVKFSPEEIKARKKLNPMELAVGSLKKAMDVMFYPGIEKKNGRKRPNAKVSTFRSEFQSIDDASPHVIAHLLQTKGYVGVILTCTPTFVNYQGGILRVSKSTRKDCGLRRHTVVIVAYGITADGTLFFLLRNSWGSTWGERGYARVIFEGGSNVFYLNKFV